MRLLKAGWEEWMDMQKGFNKYLIMVSAVPWCGRLNKEIREHGEKG